MKTTTQPLTIAAANTIKARDDVLSVAENDPKLETTATTGVLANDGDTTAPTVSVKSVNGSVANVGTVIEGKYGQLELFADGHYTYTQIKSKVDKLTGRDKGVDTFTYVVKADDSSMAERTDTANLKIEITGKNDDATIKPKDDKTTFSLDNQDPSFGPSLEEVLKISDEDKDEAALIGVNTKSQTIIELEYGDITFIPTITLDTSVIEYKIGYARTATNGGKTASADTIRHDLITLQSVDKTANETLDFAIGSSGEPGTVTKQEFHTTTTASLKVRAASSGFTDTLVLEGTQLPFDFTGTETTTNIKSIEVVDITGSTGSNNTIKLDLNSLTQTDLNGGVHKLFIKGDSGDTVLFNLDSTPTAIAHDATARLVDGTSYWVYHIGTDELLVQTAISQITVNG